MQAPRFRQVLMGWGSDEGEELGSPGRGREQWEPWEVRLEKVYAFENLSTCHVPAGYVTPTSVQVGEPGKRATAVRSCREQDR